MAKTAKQSAYRRGDKKHYATLARKSVDSRIRRHIDVEVYIDPKRVTKIPTRKRESDAGYDVYSPSEVNIKPGQVVSIPTGVHVKCPNGYFFELRGRSSNNSSFIVTDDIIDATYTGEICVRLTNITDEVIKVDVGQRIAQLIFLPQIHVKFKQVEVFAISDEDRGPAGFGSTGR